MRITFLLAAVLLMGNLQAQSKRKIHPITKETFKVKLRVEKNNQLKVLSLVDTKGNRRKAEAIMGKMNPESVRLKPGTLIVGAYRFSSFASDGGLGGTRIVRGRGKGYLKIAKITLDDQLILKNKLMGVGDMAIHLK